MCRSARPLFARRLIVALRKDEASLRLVLGHLLGGGRSAGQQAEAIAATLRLEGYDEPSHLQELQPHLHFRLLLLVQKRPPDFSSAEAFCAWAERQLALMLGGLIGVLRMAPGHAIGGREPAASSASQPGASSSDEPQQQQQQQQQQLTTTTATATAATASSSSAAEPPRVAMLINELRRLCERVRQLLDEYPALAAAEAAATAAAEKKAAAAAAAVWSAARAADAAAAADAAKRAVPDPSMITAGKPRPNALELPLPLLNLADAVTSRQLQPSASCGSSMSHNSSHQSLQNMDGGAGSSAADTPKSPHHVSTPTSSAMMMMR